MGTWAGELIPSGLPSFQKYRGLKSFRTSPWDPKENLPRDYVRIFQFQDFSRTRRHVLRQLKREEDSGAAVGPFCGTICAICVVLKLSHPLFRARKQGDRSSNGEETVAHLGERQDIPAINVNRADCPGCLLGSQPTHTLIDLQPGVLFRGLLIEVGSSRGEKTILFPIPLLDCLIVLPPAFFLCGSSHRPFGFPASGLKSRKTLGWQRVVVGEN